MSDSCDQTPTCPGCGRSFTCGMDAGWARCWCADMPPLPSPAETGGICYCPDCLKKKLEGKPLKPD